MIGAFRAGLGVALVPFVVLNAAAQASDSIPSYRGEGVTVTATRDATDRGLVTRRVDLVGGSEMLEAGAHDVADGLRATTPVDVIAYPGLLTGVSVRGFRPQITGINPKTLILVNGRPAGTTNLALLPLAGVERVEVLRGPASALYGSSAMSGVINVITNRSRQGLSGSASFGYGSFGQYKGSLALGGSLIAGADFDLALTTSGRRGDFRTGSHRTFGTAELAKVGADGTESTVPRIGADSLVSFAEYGAYGAFARIGIPLGNRLRLDFSGDRFSSDDVQNPGDLTPQDFDGRSIKDVARSSVDAVLSGPFGGHEPLARVFRTSEVIDYYSSPESPRFVNFRTPTSTVGGQLQDVIRFGLSSLTLGVDMTRTTAVSEAFSEAPAQPGMSEVAGDSVIRSAPYSPDASIQSVAAFSQARVVLADARVVISAGARLDRVDFEVRETPLLSGYPANEEDHLVFSPNAGARVGLTDALALYANVGRGFVAPEPFSVAGYVERSAGQDRRAVNITRGNPGLRPESSWTWDAGVGVKDWAGVEAELGYFRTRVDGRIASVLIVPGEPQLTLTNDTILSITSYENVDEAEIAGIEGKLDYRVPGIFGAGSTARVFLNGTRILRAVDRDVEGNTTRKIYNVADLTLIAGVEAGHERGLSGRFSARYVGKREDTDYVAWWAPGTIRYPAYLVFDLTGAVTVGDRYRIGFEIRNLANEDYFEVRGYNMPGRSLGLRLEAAL